jgi:Zn-dependent protease with chaperone function
LGYSHLVHVGIALLCLLGADAYAPEFRVSCWLLVAFAFVPHLLVKVARRFFLLGHHREGARLLELQRHAPVMLYAFAVFACAWGEQVQRWTGMELFADGLWPRPALLLALAPWFVFELLAVDAQARLRSATRAGIAEARAFELRMRAAALVPLGFMYALCLAVGWNDEWRMRATTVGLVGAAFAAGLLVAMLLCVPLLLRFAWGARPLGPPELRAVLDEVAARAEFRCAAVFEWRTGMRIANAAILGLGQRTRIVVFTDALLAQLDLRELRAVYAHEIGHAKSQHLIAFAAWTIVLLIGGGWLLESALPVDEWWSMLALLPLIAAWFLSLGWLSRRFELEADLHALRVLGEPHALISALERVTGAHAHDKDSWRHFSSKKRIDFLLRAAGEPSVGNALTRLLRACRIAGLVLGSGVVVARGASFALHWSEDMAWADLRLGQYERALERGAQSDDGQLEKLVARAVTLSSDASERDPKQLIERAAGHYDAAAFDAGREWLELAALRGDEQAIELLENEDEIVALTDDDYGMWQLVGMGGSNPTPWKTRLGWARAAARRDSR